MFITALLLASTQAAAEPQSTPAPVSQTAPASAKVKEKKICRVDDADSGSHMVKRLCLTAEEWQNRGHGMTNNSRAGFTGKPTDN